MVPVYSPQAESEEQALAQLKVSWAILFSQETL